MEQLYTHTWGPAEIDQAKKLSGPILILGASGFIGAKLFFTLSQYRDDVFGCSRNINTSWRFKNDAWRNLTNVDITDHQALEQSVRKLKPKTIFNLSAYGGHSDQTDIELIHRVNYFGTLNVLRILPTIQCKAFVQAGSSSEYGLNSNAPLEKDELAPNSDYSVSKIGASYLIKYYGGIMGLPVMHLRLYSIYGPWQERKTLMPILISQCLKNTWPSLVEKEISHDFVYIDDCTNAFVKAALHLYDKNDFGVSVNIATGIKTTMEDLVGTAKKVFGVTGNPRFATIPNKKWDVQNWYGNPKLADIILNWRHTTPLEKGLKLTADWEQLALTKLFT